MVAGPAEAGTSPPGDWTQVTIFLSPLDVHINRSPVEGRVTRIEYRPGRFLPAYDARANENELNEIWVDADGTPVVFRQVVGVLARRIVCRIEEGQRVRAGRADRPDEVRIADGRVPPAGRRAPGPRRRRPSRRGKPSSPGCGATMLPNLPLRRRRADRPQRFRRGVFLLPSLFTVANLFCGYACIVYSTRGDFDTAALFIGVAMILDTLDGFFARLTNSSTDFGVQLDSLADMVSFGLAPAVLAFTWGLWPLKRLGWAAGFLYVTATAMRLARFNIQTASVTDKRYFVGMPSPPAAGVIAATVYLYPYGLQDRETALPALAMVLVPALLMVSTFRFRSIKAINVGWRRSYFVLFLSAVVLALIATHPRLALVVLAYTYLLSAFIGLAYSRLRSRPPARATGKRTLTVVP